MLLDPHYNVENLSGYPQCATEKLTYRMTSSSDEMSGLLLVNGAATDASASDNEIPMSAVLRAGASFAPSPVNPLNNAVVSK